MHNLVGANHVPKEASPLKRRSAPIVNREGIAYAVEVERVSGRLERMLSSRLLGDGDDILGLLRLLGLALQRLR
jgi:hypothetical protein